MSHRFCGDCDECTAPEQIDYRFYASDIEDERHCAVCGRGQAKHDMDRLETGEYVCSEGCVAKEVR